MKHTVLICALFVVGSWGCSKSKNDSKPKPAAEQTAPAAKAEPEATPVAKAEPIMPQLLADGATAPDFTMKDHNGNEVALASLKGKPVVLYWYPKDETPG